MTRLKRRNDGGVITALGSRMSPASTLLEEIRAEPLTNYCAWNEPYVPVRRAPAPDRRWFRFGAEVAGVLIAAVAVGLTVAL